MPVAVVVVAGPSRRATRAMTTLLARYPGVVVGPELPRATGSPEDRALAADEAATVAAQALAALRGRPPEAADGLRAEGALVVATAYPSGDASAGGAVLAVARHEAQRTATTVVLPAARVGSAAIARLHAEAPVVVVTRGRSARPGKVVGARDLRREPDRVLGEVLHVLGLPGGELREHVARRRAGPRARLAVGGVVLAVGLVAGAAMFARRSQSRA